MTVCPHCGSNSTDQELCDRCHRDLRTAPPARGLPHFVALGDGRLVDCSSWQGAWPADCWQPLTVRVGDQPYRLYALGPDWWQNLAPAVRERAACAVDVLAPIEIIPVGEGAIVAAHGLPGGQGLSPLRPGTELEQLDRLEEACQALAALLRPLHDAGLVWLNFHPDELEWSASGARITNLDVCLFRGGEWPEGLPLSGPYSPAEVCGGCPQQIGPATDVFHLSAYAYYRLAGLLPFGFPGQGPEAFDFDFPPPRVYRPCLPIGIAPVLERGLAADPAQRYPSIDAFMQVLDEAIARAHQRQAAASPLAFDVGGLTVTGRAKSALGGANQDAFVLAKAAGGPFVLVADGVTQARIGSGDLASQTVCAVLAPLAGRLPASPTEDEMHDLLWGGCLEASRAVLRRALALGPLPRGALTNDLMSSTVLLGAVCGNRLSLANAGDSRAYLLTAQGAEQLTVDGDVYCVQLALGTAPEDVRALGAEGQSLYFCLGVCEPAPFGGLRCSIERSAPQVTHWPLLPGDVVLFCTDGLIEEGAFLTPAEVAECVRANPGDSAQALAERLVALADGRQRLPSPEEPDGFGDNITCVVMKVLAAREEEGRQGP